jgi:hypothetical protein
MAADQWRSCVAGVPAAGLGADVVDVDCPLVSTAVEARQAECSTGPTPPTKVRALLQLRRS